MIKIAEFGDRCYCREHEGAPGVLHAGPDRASREAVPARLVSAGCVAISGRDQLFSSGLTSRGSATSSGARSRASPWIGWSAMPKSFIPGYGCKSLQPRRSPGCTRRRWNASGTSCRLTSAACPRDSSSEPWSEVARNHVISRDTTTPASLFAARTPNRKSQSGNVFRGGFTSAVKYQVAYFTS